MALYKTMKEPLNTLDVSRYGNDPRRSASAASGFDRRFNRLLQLSFVFAIWLLIFAIQHRWRAAQIWLAGGDSTPDMAAIAQDGDVLRRLCLLTLAGIGLALLIFSRRKFAVNGIVGWAWIVYVCWICCSVLWSETPDFTLRRLATFSTVFTFLFACAVTLSLDVLASIAVLFTSLNVVVGVCAEVILGTFHPFSAGYRFSGTLHPNLQGASLATTVVLLLWRVWKSSGTSRALAVSVALILSILLFLTGSRTSIVAMLAAVIFLIALTQVRGFQRSRSRALAIIASLFLAFGAVTTLEMIQQTEPWVPTAIQQERDEGDASELTGRIALWNVCLAYFEEKPITGYGYDSFWSAEKIESISSDLHWNINQAHSSYIDTALSLGMPGLLGYLLIAVASLIKATKLYLGGKNEYAVWAALIIFVLVHNLTESINILPTFSGFASNLISLHLGFYGTRFRLQRHFLAVARSPFPSPTPERSSA